MKWPLLPLHPGAARYNPYNPSYIRDPYRQLDRLRASAPVYYSKVTGSYGGSSHALATEGLGDPRGTSKRKTDTSLPNPLLLRFGKFSPAGVRAQDNTLPSVSDHVCQAMLMAIPYDLSKGRIM